MVSSKMQWFGTLLYLIFFLRVETAFGCEKLLINGGHNWYPYFYQDETNHKGIIGDIVLRAAAHTGIKTEIAQAAPWKRILFDLRSGRLDVVAGALKTEEREKLFSYSSPVYFSQFRIFVHRDHQFNFSTLEDLIGKHGVKIRGLSLGENLDQFAFENLVIEEITDTNSLFKMVAAKRVDYGIFYHYSGLSEIDRLNLGNTLIPLPTPLTQEPLYVAFSRKSRCLEQIQQLSKEIARMKENGAIQEIADYYARFINNRKVLRDDD